MIDVNVASLINTVHAVLPFMLDAGGGKSSPSGRHLRARAIANMARLDSAAKSAVIRLSEAMAQELREKNINVNCVLPSIIDTPDNRAAMPKADAARWVTPDQIADLMVFRLPRRRGDPWRGYPDRRPFLTQGSACANQEHIAPQ